MSVTDWKAREKEQRRNDIIETAEKLFFSRGYDNVSMDDIAKAIKLNKATLYLYFTSKDALFFNIVLRGVRIEHAMIMKCVKKGADGAENVIALGNASYEFAKKYPDYKRIINYYHSGRFDLAGLTGGIEAAGRKHGDKAGATEAEAIRGIQTLRKETLDAMLDSVKAGTDDGTLRPGMKPEELVIFLSLISESLINMSPVYQCMLWYMGVSQDAFIKDSRAYMRHMYLNE